MSRKKKNKQRNKEAGSFFGFEGFEENLTEKKVFIYVMLAAFLVLIAVPVARFYLTGTTAIPPSDTPYYNHRMSVYEQNAFPEFSLSRQDDYIFGSRKYSANLLNIGAGALSFVIPLSFIVLALPVLFGLISMLVFYLILSKLEKSLLKKLIICAILLASPVFINTFVIFSPNALSVLLLILAFFLFIQENKLLAYFSFLLMLIIPSFGLFAVIFILGAMFCYYIYKKEKAIFINFLIAAGILVLSSLFIFLPYLQVISNYEYILLNPLSQFISDLGAPIGFGVFNLLLMFFGLAVLLRQKERHNYILLIFVVISFLFSFYIDPSVNIYLNFLVSILAAYGLLKLIRIKWTVVLVKRLTVIIVVCGLSFSCVSYINRLSMSAPSKDYAAALDFLGRHDAKNYGVVLEGISDKDLNRQTDSASPVYSPHSVVLSHYSNSFILQDFGFVTVTDPLFSTYNAKQRLNDSDTAFQSRKLKTTKDLLDKYSVRYIFITKDMRQGAVWWKEEQGMLFLLKNAPADFAKIYSSEEIEIWEYKNNGV